MLEVIGTCPSTGEVVVRDTATGDMSWQPGTESQINSVTAAIEKAGDFGKVTYEKYDAPVLPLKPPAKPKKIPLKVYVAPIPRTELAAAAQAVTTGGYFGISAIASIIDVLNSVSSWFYEIYLDVYGWVWPFWLTAGLFYQLCLLFNTLAWRFYDFSSWVSYVSDKIGGYLSWNTIWSYILSYIPNLVAIQDWFYSWWNNVTSVITSWWSATMVTVKAWIQAASDELKSYINSILLVVNSLAAAWDSFKGKIPTIDQVISWWGNWTGNVTAVINTWWTSRLLEVQGLIRSAFTARASLWAGWQEMRDQVVEFFTDPEQWLYNRLDSFFERFW